MRPSLQELSAGERASTVDVAALVHRLAPEVHRWIACQVGGSDVDDIVQEALIELAGALPRFRGESKLTVYARRIVQRVIHRSLRHARRHRHTPLEVVPEPSERRDPESIAMRRESLRRLYRCLDRLPPKRRAAFILCDVERLPHAEAAEVLQCSVETLRARRKRARAELARRLSADPYLAPLFEEGTR